MSYVSSIYHIIFSTYRREPTVPFQYSSELYAVIAAEIKKLGCMPYIINGTQDHLHLLIGLHPCVALSSLMRDIKSKSSVWAKASGKFPLFNGWEHEYGAFSLSFSHKEAVYNYIKDQRIHHNTVPLEAEYRRLIIKAGLKYYTDAN